MNNFFKKVPLDFNEYEKFGINQAYEAFIITMEKITLAEAESIEEDFITNHYKVFKNDLKIHSEGLYNLEMIIAKGKGFTF
ncbi:MAG: hypothetical protein N4A33_05120 [Bacteriovoracaceae bacterium]|jgi:hypothetical protein|nr:hypothetical protein [Bacteriovoracaceae bacterium]